MTPFLSDDFLLQSKTARTLYHQHAAPQPDAKPAPAMAAQPEGKPNTSPRPEVIQGDKPSNAPGRRA